jgi:hypothetical protein
MMKALAQHIFKVASHVRSLDAVIFLVGSHDRLIAPSGSFLLAMKQSSIHRVSRTPQSPTLSNAIRNAQNPHFPNMPAVPVSSDFNHVSSMPSRFKGACRRYDHPVSSSGLSLSIPSAFR